MSVTEVCFAVGCSSLGSFSSKFSELVGETPSAYKARDHEELVGVPSCQMMVVSRPRKDRTSTSAEVSGFREATLALPP
jgi:AraC-like DNA-binding protein